MAKIVETCRKDTCCSVDKFEGSGVSLLNTKHNITTMNKVKLN
jgi:hypothetical protein